MIKVLRLYGFSLIRFINTRHKLNQYFIFLIYIIKKTLILLLASVARLLLHYLRKITFGTKSIL